MELRALEKNAYGSVVAIGTDIPSGLRFVAIREILWDPRLGEAVFLYALLLDVDVAHEAP